MNTNRYRKFLVGFLAICLYLISSSSFANIILVEKYADLESILSDHNLSGGEIVKVSEKYRQGEFIIYSLPNHGEQSNGGTRVRLSANLYAERLFSGLVDVAWFGVLPDDINRAEINTLNIAKALKAATHAKGVKISHAGDYYFSDSIYLDSGRSIVGVDGVTYREDQGLRQSKLIFLGDGDGITIGGNTSKNNTIKNLKIEKYNGSNIYTGVGINLEGPGCKTCGSGIGTVIENVTVQNFFTGVILGRNNEQNWFKNIRNLKIFRSAVHLVVDGSNGASSIDGLHIDGNGGYPGERKGIVVRNSNGLSIVNFSIEHCSVGVEVSTNDPNDRIILSDGYFESNSSKDISFTTNSIGQLYLSRARFANFKLENKEQSIFASSGSNINASFSDIIFRGETDGSGSPGALFKIYSPSARIFVDGLLIQQKSKLWEQSESTYSPVYIKLSNPDKNSNWAELRRDTLKPARMIISTDRVSVVKPNDSTFQYNLPGGNTLDLKTENISIVNNISKNGNITWVWDCSRFIRPGLDEIEEPCDID